MNYLWYIDILRCHIFKKINFSSLRHRTHEQGNGHVLTALIGQGVQGTGWYWKEHDSQWLICTGALTCHYLPNAYAPSKEKLVSTDFFRNAPLIVMNHVEHTEAMNRERCVVESKFIDTANEEQQHFKSAMKKRSVMMMYMFLVLTVRYYPCYNSMHICLGKRPIYISGIDFSTNINRTVQSA